MAEERLMETEVQFDFSAFLLVRNPSSFVTPFLSIPTHSHSSPPAQLPCLFSRFSFIRQSFFAAIYIFLVCHVHSLLPKYCCCFHFKRNFHRLFKLPSLTTHKLERTSVSFLRSPDSVYIPLIQHQNELRPQN